MSEKVKIYISGCFAGFMSLLAFVPTELIKIRIQDNHVNTENIGSNRSKSLYKTITREIYSKDGLLGFYRGFWP